MIKKNIAYSSITAGLKLVSGFFLLIVIARIISVNEFGIFMYALTYSTLFGLFIDYGYQIRLLKDIPQDVENLSYIVSTALLSKLFIFLISLPFLVFFVLLTSLTSKELNLVTILLLGYVAGSFANTMLISYKCTNRFEVESKYVFMDTVAIVTLIALASLSEADSLDIALAFLLAKLFYVFLVLSRYRKEYAIKRTSIADSMSDLILGIPFAIHYIVGSLYLNVDTLIIKEFASFEDVAIYQSGIRLVVGAGIVLSVLNSVLTPRFVQYLVNDRNRLSIEVNNSIKAILVLGSLGAYLAFQYSEEIAVIIYGDKYSDLGALLPIFAIIIFLRTLGTIYGILLTIGGSQNIRAVAVLGTLILVIVLNFIVVPRIGIEGAAYVLLVAHIALMLIYMINVKKVYSKLFIL